MSEQVEHFFCCGRAFRDAHALEQHVRDSPNHQLPSVGRDGTSYYSSQTPLGAALYSDSSIPRTAGVGCPCGGRIVGGANGLERWNHGEPSGPAASHHSLGTGFTPTLGSDDDGLRHQPVTFVKEGQVKERKGKAEGKGKGKEKGKGIGKGKGSASPSHQSYGVYSGSGQWYSDVGDDHSLCDKDCGWCGHCAEGVLY